MCALCLGRLPHCNDSQYQASGPSSGMYVLPVKSKVFPYILCNVYYEEPLAAAETPGLSCRFFRFMGACLRPSTRPSMARTKFLG